MHNRNSLLFSGGICLVCSSCLPPCQCPPWHCLGSLVHFVGPFWSWPKLFGITICSVLSSLLPHLSDWQAPAVYRKIPVYRDWTQIPIPGFLKIKYRYFSGFWYSMCVLKLPAREDAKSHWLHLFDFSPLCVFMCFFKLTAWEDAKSHWLRLFDFSPLMIMFIVMTIFFFLGSLFISPSNRGNSINWSL